MNTAIKLFFLSASIFSYGFCLVTGCGATDALKCDFDAENWHESTTNCWRFPWLVFVSCMNNIITNLHESLNLEDWRFVSAEDCLHWVWTYACTQKGKPVGIMQAISCYLFIQRFNRVMHHQDTSWLQLLLLLQRRITALHWIYKFLIMMAWKHKVVHYCTLFLKATSSFLVGTTMW